MSANPITIAITFKSGKTASYPLSDEVLEQLTNAFSAYWTSGNPKGVWLDTVSENQRSRLFLQFDEIMYIG